MRVQQKGVPLHITSKGTWCGEAWLLVMSTWTCDYDVAIGEWTPAPQNIQTHIFQAPMKMYTQALNPLSVNVALLGPRIFVNKSKWGHTSQSPSTDVLIWREDLDRDTEIETYNDREVNTQAREKQKKQGSSPGQAQRTPCYQVFCLQNRDTIQGWLSLTGLCHRS